MFNKLPRNRIYLFFILFLALSNNLKAENVAKFDKLQTLDELHQIYADYNYVDNVYDAMQNFGETVAVTFGNNLSTMDLATESAGKIYMMSANAEHLASDLADLQYAQNGLEEKNLNTQLMEMKKIIIKMMDLKYQEYDIYKKTMILIVVSKDPNFKDVLLKTGSEAERKFLKDNESLEDLLLETQEISAKFEGLEQQLSKEQEKIIKYHKELTEKLKKAII